VRFESDACNPRTVFNVVEREDMTMKAQETIGNPIRLLMYVPVPWVFILTYLAGVAIERARPPLTGEVHGTKVAGAVLFALGAAIAGWGQVLFRKAHTTTVPGQKSASLVTSGPYRFSRNPMYVGLVLAYLGEAGMLKQMWPVILLPLIVAYLNWIVIPVEEARLGEAFGEEYERYRASVRRWL
jgi:protein-S-isoprenylcysteine O-methyltransferase Ste14